MTEPTTVAPKPATPATDPAPTPASAARLVYFVLLIFSLILVSTIFVPVWKPVVLGAVLAATLIRYYEKFVVRLRGRKSLAGILMTIGVLVFVLLPLAGVLSFLVVQGTQAAKVISDLLNSSHGLEEFLAMLPDSVQGSARTLVEMVPIDLQQLSQRAAEGGKWAATTVGSVLSVTSSIVFSLSLALISFYFFLVDGPAFVRWLAEVLPLKDRQTYEVLDDFRQMARAVIGSNIIVGGTQAIVAGIGYTIAPIPHPIFFGIVTFLASFIPSVGTAIVSIPLIGLLLLVGKPWWALFLAIWCLGLVGAVDNILRPILLRGAGHVHAAIVFFSLIGGIGIFGPMGLIVGPLAITFVVAMIRLWQRDFNPQTRRPESVLDDRPREALVSAQADNKV
ncbi:MAG: AI-2E family transporter [Myxococcota bacterium]